MVRKHSVVPRSGSLTINADTRANPGSTGHRIRPGERRSSRSSRRASRSAAHSSMANLANSLGWICTGPTFNQRRAALISTPTCGTKTASSMITASSSTG